MGEADKQGTKVGGAYIQITADSGPAEKAVATFFNWFTRTGEAATELAGKISGTIEKAKDLGEKGSQSAKTVSASFQSLTQKMKDSNASLSADSKKTFATIEKTSESTFKAITSDNKAMNGALILAATDTVADLGKAFKNLGQAVKSIFTETGSTIKKIPSAAIDVGKKITSFISSGFQNAKELAQAHIEGIKNKVLSIPKVANSAGMRIKAEIVTAFSGMVNPVTDKINKIAQSLSQLPTKARESAANLKKSFVDGISNIPQKANDIWSKVKQGVKDLPQTAASAANNIKTKITDGFQAVKAKAASVFPSVKRDIQNGIDNPAKESQLTLGKLVTALGLVKAASAAFGFLKNALSGAISRYDTLQQFPKMMEKLGYATSDVEGATTRLKEGIRGLPTKLDEVVSTAQRLTFLNKDIEKSSKLTIALNNAFLSSGSSGEAASRGLDQFVQMLSVGQVDMEAWKTLQETMGYGLDKVAQSFGFAGVSAQRDLYAALKEGTITFDEFQNRLMELNEGVDGFAAVAKESGAGIGVAVGNMTYAFTSGLEKIMTKIHDTLQEKGLETFEQRIANLQVKIEGAFKSIEEKIPELIDKLLEITEVVKKLTPAIKVAVAAIVTFAVLNTITGKITLLKQTIHGLSMAYKGLELAANAAAASEKAFAFASAINPITIVITAIVALGVAFYQLYKHSEKFKGFIDGLRETFRQGLNEKYFSSDMNILEKGIYQLGKTIKWLKNLTQTLYEIFTWRISGDGIAKLGDQGIFSERTVAILQNVLKYSRMVMDVISALVAVIKGYSTSLEDLNNRTHGVFGGKTLSIILKLGEAIRNFVAGAKEQFTLFQRALGSAFKGNFDPLLEFVQALLPRIIALLIGGLPGLVITGSRLISKIAEGMGVTVPELVQKGVEVITNLILGIVQFIPKLIETGLTLINTVIGVIVTALPLIMDAGIQILMSLIQGILIVIPSLVNTAVTLFTTLVTKFIEMLPMIIESGVKILAALIEGIMSILPQLLATVLKLIIAIVAAVIQNLPKMWDAGWKILIAIGKGILSAIGTLIGMLPKVYESIKKSFLSVNWKKLGSDVLDGIIKGFTNGFKKAKETVEGFANDIAGWFSKKLKIKSPSRVMIGIAKWIPEGVAVGIEKGLPVIENAVSTMTDMMTKAVQDAEPVGLSSNMIVTESYGMPDESQMQASAQQASQAGNQGMSDSTPQLLQTALSAANGILGQFSSISPSMITQGADWLTNFMNGWNSIAPTMLATTNSFIVQYTTLITSQNSPNYQMGRTWMQNKLNGWNSFVSTFITTVRNFCNQVLNLLRSFYNAMYQTGRTWLQNLLNGWNSLYQTFINRVNQLGNDAINNLRSKSGGFNSAGRFLMQSLIDGINSMGGSLSATMNSVANKMVGGIGKGVNGVISGVNYVLKEVESDKKLGAWTVPQYAKGTDGHPADGPAIVNDQKGSKYQEIIQEPDGSTFIAKGRNALVWLKKGAKVLNATMTERVLKAQNNLGSMIPKYEDGIGEFDIFDLIDDEGAFKKLVDQRVDYNSIVEPWRNMTKAGVKLMTNAAYPFAQKQVEDAYGGSFDGAMNANNVYQYLVDIAQKVMSKFGGLTITSGYRPGDPYYHGKHQALDISGYPYGSPRYTEAANWAFEKFPKQIAYVITNGRVRDRVGMSGQAATGQWVPWPDGDHYDHIHLNGSLGAGSVYKAGTDVAGGLPTPGGSAVERWRSYVKKALKMNGLPTTQAYVNAWMSQIQTESGGNPSAIGGNDGLADGNATGLLQTKPGTFAANAFPGHGNIMNGFDNILAAIRYAKGRYGSNMLGVIGHGHGYENGGWITQDGLYRAGEKGKPEVVLPVTKPARAIELIGQALNFMAHNGSGIIQSATTGLSNMASNMTLNLADLIGLDTQAIRSNFAGSTNIDLQEIIQLLSVNNQLLTEIRDKETDVYFDKNKVTREVMKTARDRGY